MTLSIAFESTNVVKSNLDDRWSKLLPELLTEIIKRVEESEDRWPLRRSVVACACVCRRWREVALRVVRSPLDCGQITFPFSLKQVGPRMFPMQCLIKRDRRNSMFYLYLCLTQTKHLQTRGNFYWQLRGLGTRAASNLSSLWMLLISRKEVTPMWGS